MASSFLQLNWLGKTFNCCKVTNKTAVYIKLIHISVYKHINLNKIIKHLLLLCTETNICDELVKVNNIYINHMY